MATRHNKRRHTVHAAACPISARRRIMRRLYLHTCMITRAHRVQTQSILYHSLSRCATRCRPLQLTPILPPQRTHAHSDHGSHRPRRAVMLHSTHEPQLPGALSNIMRSERVEGTKRAQRARSKRHSRLRRCRHQRRHRHSCRGVLATAGTTAAAAASTGAVDA